MGKINFAGEARSRHAAKIARAYAIGAGFLLVCSSAVQAGDTGTEMRAKQSLTLSEAIRLAMMHNPEIKIALQEIRRNKAIVVETRAPALPQVSFSAVFTKIDPRLLDLPNTVVTTGAQTFLPLTESYILTGSVRQVLFSAGIAPRVRAARLETDNAFYQLRETVNRIENQVRRDFYQALLSDSVVTTQEEAISLLQIQVTDQQKRFAAGDITKFGPLQAQVALANQRPAAMTARTSARLARVRLAQTIGLPEGASEQRIHPFRLQGSLEVAPEKISAQRALDFAHANRPALKLRQQNIAIEDQRIKAARAGYFPVVSANANYQVHNSQDDLAGTVNGYFAGVSLDWNIFDGAATKARVEGAQTLLEEANLRLLEAGNAVEVEVLDAYERLEEARRLIQAQRENLGQSREAYDLAQAQLQAGQGTQIDVLSSQVGLTQTRVTELQALFSYNVAAADLDHAIGSSKAYLQYFDDPLLRQNRSNTTRGQEK